MQYAVGQRKELEAGVLLVDDEPLNLRLATGILGDYGFRVLAAGGAREALKLFLRERPDVVVTDLQMPEMGGIELLELVRSIDEDVPVVILTGHATLETATHAISRGAFEYLLKPVEAERLRATVRRAVDRYRLVKENRRLLRELGAANARLAAMNVTLKGEVAAATRELGLERDLLAQIHAAVPSALAVLAPAAGAAAELDILRENAAWRRLGPLEPALRAAIAKEVAAAMGSRREAACDVRRTLAAGAGEERRVFEVSVLPLAGGRALAVAQDFTERTRLEEELVQAEKLSSLGLLAGGIVHDLSNPLSAILGMAQLLQQDLGAAHAEKLDAIVSSARYMHAVCVELNHFTRRAKPGAAERVDVNELCQKALGLARHAQKFLEAEVDTRLDPCGPAVSASENELLQVLVNLIVNAADAAPRGKIVVATWVVPPQRVAIAVHDDGPGIPEALRARVFEPFFTTKEPGKGTGLGLSITKRIVARVGGEIALETGPRGTTFTVLLPAAAPPPSTPDGAGDPG